MNVQTVTRAISTCFYEKKTVKSGFSEPKECNCKLNTCVAKVYDELCLVENSNCQKQRSLFLKHNSQVPKIFTDLNTKIEGLKIKVESGLVEIQRRKKEKQFSEREYYRIKDLSKNAQQESHFANATELNVQEMIARDICLLNEYNKQPNLFKLLKLERLTFKGLLPFTDNIKIIAEVRKLNTGNIEKVMFLYEFDDSQLS